MARQKTEDGRKKVSEEKEEAHASKYPHTGVAARNDKPETGSHPFGTYFLPGSLESRLGRDRSSGYSPVSKFPTSMFGRDGSSWIDSGLLAREPALACPRWTPRSSVIMHRGLVARANVFAAPSLSAASRTGKSLSCRGNPLSRARLPLFAALGPPVPHWPCVRQRRGPVPTTELPSWPYHRLVWRNHPACHFERCPTPAAEKSWGVLLELALLREGGIDKCSRAPAIAPAISRGTASASIPPSN